MKFKNDRQSPKIQNSRISPYFYIIQPLELRNNLTFELPMVFNLTNPMRTRPQSPAGLVGSLRLGPGATWACYRSPGAQGPLTGVQWLWTHLLS